MNFKHFFLVHFLVLACTVYGRDVLPTNVVPIHYNLMIETDMDALSYTGMVNIDLKVNNPTDVIVLHSDSLAIFSAQVGETMASKIEFNKLDQTVALTFPTGTVSSLSDVKLKIAFGSKLNNNMIGFYRAKYSDAVSGETKYMAVTHMEPTYARKAFPCFDEPSLKATFNITLVSKPNFTHLSNMSVHQSFIQDGLKKTIFNTTPRMSTYLVAFIVSELEYVENNTLRIPVRVYATPGNKEYCQYAVDVAAKTIDFFEKSFKIQYPLEKLDNVAVPEFSSGAMENWGLITYRIVDLLLDQKSATIDATQRVTEVVQHELAHQWFGNLVTMEWWDGLWLNEGFATWMSQYSCDHFYKDWTVWESYVSSVYQRAMNLDALRSSHPIEVPLNNSNQVHQIFDAISYSKGSSVLRMIANWLGEDVFIQGVANYLEKYKYKNTKTENLWDSLSEASNKNVKDVMDCWTKKTGFPLVSVEEDGNTIKLTQNRYLVTNDVEEAENELYTLFVSLKTKNGVEKNIMMGSKSLTVPLQDTDFYKINGNQIGLYRTLYPQSRLNQLIYQTEYLSVEDRIGLIADLKALSSSGHTSTLDLINFIWSWRNEESLAVWKQILTSLESMRSSWLMQPDSETEVLNAFIEKVVVGKLDQLKWEMSPSDSFQMRQLKALLFSEACTVQNPKAIGIAKHYFKMYYNGNSAELPSLLRQTVFEVATFSNSNQNYDTLWQIYKTSSTPDERIAALRSIGHFTDPILLDKTIKLLLDGSVLDQDVYILMSGLRSHKEGFNMLWEWLKYNWDYIQYKFPPEVSTLGTIVTICTSGFSSLSKLKEIESFFAQRSTIGFEQSLSQSLDVIKMKARWLSKDANLVYNHLSKLLASAS